MRKVLEAIGVGVAVFTLVLGTTLVAAVTLGDNPSSAARPVSLTVFVGSATIQRAGSAVSAVGHSGEGLGSGDSVTTGESSKASLRYPDGSVTRLDSSTRVTLTVSARSSDGGGLQAAVAQAAGLTWNRVQKLVGASSFKVTGPNNSSAEVRGTGFGYYIEHDAAGSPVIWIDVYDGVVDVGGAVGAPVPTGAGQRVTVRPGAIPTSPVAIPDSDKHIDFTVFNRAVEAVAGTPIAFSSGALGTGETSKTYTVQADGRTDLQFVLAAPPGSNFGLTVTAPNGSVVFDSTSPNSPLVAFAPKAAAGAWKYTVRDLQSLPQDPYWVVVGRS